MNVSRGSKYWGFGSMQQVNLPATSNVHMTRPFERGPSILNHLAPSHSLAEYSAPGVGPAVRADNTSPMASVVSTKGAQEGSSQDQRGSDNPADDEPSQLSLSIAVVGGTHDVGCQLATCLAAFWLCERTCHAGSV